MAARGIVPWMQIVRINDPRPPPQMWSAPALVDTFGDAFLDGTTFHGSPCIAWSFQVAWRRHGSLSA
jgi:hypothetical protein